MTSHIARVQGRLLLEGNWLLMEPAACDSVISGLSAAFDHLHSFWWIILQPDD